MKKSFIKRLVALALVIVSVFSISAVAMAETVKYVNVTPNLNFRETPGGDLIDRIPYGAAVTEHSTSYHNGTQWSYITYNGDTGYVMTKYLSVTDPDGNGNSSDNHPTSQSQAFGSYTLREGQTSYYVKNLQLALNHLGFNAGTADGIFGSGTLSAVEAFQEANDLTVDGLVGSGTKGELWSQAGDYLEDYGVMGL